MIIEEAAKELQKFKLVHFWSHEADAQEEEEKRKKKTKKTNTDTILSKSVIKQKCFSFF